MHSPSPVSILPILLSYPPVASQRDGPNEIKRPRNKKKEKKNTAPNVRASGGSLACCCFFCFSSSTLERPARDVDIVTALRVHIRFPPQFLCVVLTLLFGVALILSIWYYYTTKRLGWRRPATPKVTNLILEAHEPISASNGNTRRKSAFPNSTYSRSWALLIKDSSVGAQRLSYCSQ